MSERKVIYERKYPHKTVEELLKEDEEWIREHPEKKREGPALSFSEVYQKVMAELTFVLLPARIEGAERFIKLAIEAGELYEINTRIEKLDFQISVEYNFDCCEGMDHLMPVVRQADAMAILAGIDGYDITMVLDYCTHAVYRKGRLLRPLT